MIGLFSILFLAAIVGVFRPYAGLKRLHFGIGAFACLVAIGMLVPPSDKQSAKAGNKAALPDATPSTAGSGASSSASPSPRPGKWEYSQDKDEMRDTTTRYARLESENSIDLDFPYGEVKGILWVRHRAEDGLRVMFAVEKGQILCNSFTNTTVSIKFDDQPVQRVRCTDASDGSTETAFLEGSSRLLGNLRKAKRTIVEAEFFQKGRQQFTFETQGLQWK